MIKIINIDRINKTSKIKAVVKRLKSIISKKRNFALIYDNDPDGLCSAVITAKSLERIGKKIVLAKAVAHSSHEIEKIIKKLKNQKIDCIISCDISLDQSVGALKKIPAHTSLIIIDHHKVYNTFNSGRIFLIKPQLFDKNADPSQYCSSKLVYDIFSGIVEINDLDWIASIGIIADSNYRTWKNFVDATLKKYHLKKYHDPFKSSAGRISNLINYSEIYSRRNDRLAFNTVYDSKNYSEILKKLKRFEVVEKEIKKQLKKGSKDFERYNDLILLKIKSKFKISSIISTKLSMKNPHKTIIVLQESGKGKIFMSARRQDYKVSVNDLLERCTRNIKNSSAGGHIPAAGASVPNKSYLIFKQNLLKEIGC